MGERSVPPLAVNSSCRGKSIETEAAADVAAHNKWQPTWRIMPRSHLDLYCDLCAATSALRLLCDMSRLGIKVTLRVIYHE